ncbi:response regulator transcription factor [Pseudoxanthomonas sp. UTMC 1351]|uniref:response regulator transcription factor n=1 Tax=Pseudoxanthomonas sp. UTMC 1351 TaxID=2695853 RepID=UPI0034CD4A64
MSCCRPSLPRWSGIGRIASAATPRTALRPASARSPPREREVLDQVILGRLNKQIADTLCISLKTVKVYRGRAMAKMQVRSVAQLVRLCGQL